MVNCPLCDAVIDVDEEELDEGDMGGDASDDLIDEIETEESSDMSMEDEDMAMDAGMEGGDDEPATKDDVMNLADKIDELMAEFEAHMGGEGDSDGDDFGPEEGGDAIEMDDTEEMMSENITLKQVHPKTTTSEEGNGKAGPVAFNSGAKGMASKPVKTTGGDSAEGPHDTAAYRNSTKDLIGKVGNSPAQGTQNLKPATKPHLGQASGVNNKSPLPKV